MHQLDVAIPLQLKSQLKKGGSGQQCIGEGDPDISDTMQFVMLTRKGNKQQVKCTEKTVGAKTFALKPPSWPIIITVSERLFSDGLQNITIFNKPRNCLIFVLQMKVNFT